MSIIKSTMNYNPKIVTSEPPLASMRTMLNTKPTNISITHSQIRQPAYFVNDNAKRVVGDLYSNTTAASEQFDKLKLRNQNNKKNYYTLQLSNEVADDGSSHRQGTSKYNSYSLTNLEILSKCSRDNDSHDDGDDNRSRQTTHTGDGYFANNNRRRKSRNHLKARTTSISNDTTAKVYQKLGHRRVNESGIVSYKHCPVSELRDALKLGIRCSIESLHPDDTTRDVLLQDFNQISVQEFPAMGTKTSPVHNYRDFTFRAYAPVAFQHFRSKFNIGLNDYLISLCGHDWQELPNAGASGSIFYVTFDDKFIIKTVDAKEANFLLSLLPGYYMNLVQNPETMLPKFFGFYCYQRMDKNIRVVVMNNLVPSDANVTERYDLKGSRYKRKANDKEKQKLTPTLKDLDFLENYPRGILLESFVYDTLISILKRDLRVLRSFEIMDYSLLIAICTPSEGMKRRRSRSLTVHKKSFGKSGRIEDTTTLVADGDAISMSPFTDDGDDQQGITITAPKSDRNSLNDSCVSLTEYDNLDEHFVHYCKSDHFSDSMCNLASDASVANIHRCLSPFKNSSAFVKSSTANRDKVTKEDTIKQFRSNQYAQQQACTSVSTRKEPNKNKHQIQNSSVNQLVKPSSNLACTSDNKDDGDNDLASARPLLAEEIASTSLEIPLLSTAGNNFDDNIITDDGSSSCGDNNADGDNDSNVRKGSVISADCSMPSASINCWTQDGSNICMFIGIIDILQHYRLQKRLEHILRTSVLAHKDISVCDPQYYSTRFINFISTKVFRKSRCPLPPTYYYNDGGLAEAQIPSLLSFGVEPTIYSENLSTISSDARYAYGDGYMTAHRYTSSSIAPSSSTRKSIRRQQHKQNGDNKKRYWTTLSRTATITNNTSSLVSNYGDFDIVGVNNANDKAGVTKHTPLSAKSKRIRNAMLLSEENVEASNPPSEISILHSNKQYNRCHNRQNLNTDSNTEGVRNFTGSCADSCYGCSSSVLSFNNTNKWPQHVPVSDKLLFTKHNNRCRKDDEIKSPTAYRNCSVTKATRRNYQGDMPLPRD